MGAKNGVHRWLLLLSFGFCLPATTLGAENPFVTFIIGSNARSSLQRTIHSLYKQTHQGWEAIVVVDGWMKQNFDQEVFIDHSNLPYYLVQLLQSSYGRVRYLSLPKKIGCPTHCSGAVRNAAWRFVRTPWAAFLDDDDYARPEYVESLAKEIAEYPTAALVSFRMYLRHYFLPPLNTTDILWGKIGISFAMKTELCTKEQLCFPKGYAEDFGLLNAVKKKGYPILLSRFAVYSVKGVGLDKPLTQGDSYLIRPAAVQSSSTPQATQGPASSRRLRRALA